MEEASKPELIRHHHHHVDTTLYSSIYFIASWIAHRTLREQALWTVQAPLALVGSTQPCSRCVGLKEREEGTFFQLCVLWPLSFVCECHKHFTAGHMWCMFWCNPGKREICWEWWHLLCFNCRTETCTWSFSFGKTDPGLIWHDHISTHIPL